MVLIFVISSLIGLSAGALAEEKNPASKHREI